MKTSETPLDLPLDYYNLFWYSKDIRKCNENMFIHLGGGTVYVVELQYTDNVRVSIRPGNVNRLPSIL